MPATFSDWYCLKSGRAGFTPSNLDDCRLLLCHELVVQQEILESIQKRFATGEPVKMVIYGDWGVGKTHTLNYLKWWFERPDSEYRAAPIVFEIGDITKNSRFDSIVRPILDRIGIGALSDLVKAYMGKKGSVMTALMEAGVGASIAGAFEKLLMAQPGQATPPIVTYAFDHLRGRALPSQASAHGFGEAIEDSRDFYEVLHALGEMHFVARGSRYVFMADEAARLENIEASEESVNHWISAHRHIFDDNNRQFGFIYTLSARGQVTPRVFADDQVVERIGHNLIELRNLYKAEVADFLDKLREAFVDKTAASALVERGEVGKADFSWEHYPFTAAARERFVEYFDRTQEDSKPRDITRFLTDAAFFAMKANSRLIGPEALDRAKM